MRLVIFYNTNNPDLKKILTKHGDILYLTRKPAIKPDDIQVTYAGSTNVKDLLIYGSIYEPISIRICEPCNRQHCKTCQHIDTIVVITNRHEISYPIKGHHTCLSHDVVYVINCDMCQIQYAGETSNSLDTGCQGHERTIRTKADHPVAHHYYTYNHTLKDYSIITVNQKPDKYKRLWLEEAWMALMTH